MEQRKKDHLLLAEMAQTPRSFRDERFDYEPLLGSHEGAGKFSLSKEFLGKKLKYPLWISSMTGGTQDAALINERLARAACTFGLAMGVGSCRAFLENPKDLSLKKQFCLRPFIGDKGLYFANIGIAQVEKFVFEKKDLSPLYRLIEEIEADGLIIHMNPLQEYLQREGDTFSHPPLETLKELLFKMKFIYPVIVKEVGQGMGPRSLEALMKLPLAAIDFAAFGGTNFSKLEALRGEGRQKEEKENFSRVGHDAYDMMESFNFLKKRLKEEGTLKCSQEIVSGGIHDFLDMHFFLLKSLRNAFVGQAKPLLQRAKESQDSLDSYIEAQMEGLKMAAEYLYLKEKKE